MCLWWRSKESIESSFDPRFGSAAITAPTEGAYADPSIAPSMNVAIPPSASQPQSQLPMATISPTSQFSNAKPISLNFSSNRSSDTTSKSPLHSPAKSMPSPGRPLSSSTQFSTYHSASSSPSPQPSPKWSKSSIHGTAPNSAVKPPSRTTSPSPVPVHQAYIPADQLSIGSKLSPGFSASSATTPTTGGGPKTSNYATSPVSNGINGWGSNQPSPTNLVNGSPQLKSTAQMQQNQIQNQNQPRQSPPAQQQQAVQGIQGTQASRPQSRNRLTRIVLPNIKLGAAPKRHQTKKWERSPDSPESVEQWPGSM